MCVLGENVCWGMPTFQWLGHRSVILCCTTPPLFEPEIHLHYRTVTLPRFNITCFTHHHQFEQ